MKKVSEICNLQRSSLNCLDCLKSFSFEKMDARQINIQQPLSETCEWIFKTTEYKEWSSRQNLEVHHGILWIKGKPGSGKSTLMKQVVQRSLNSHINDPNTIILQFYFFARGKSVLEKSPLGMYRSLLHQLLVHTRRIPSAILQRFITKRSTLVKWDWETQEVQEMFLNTMTSEEAAGRHIIIYADALDECSEDEVREIISLFERAAIDAVVNIQNLNFCFSSRHYPSIRTEHCHELWMEHHNGSDVDLYITSKLAKLFPKLKLDDEGKLKESLITRASHVFLWVFLVMPKLISARQKGASAQWLLDFVKDVPDDLANLFKQLFDSIKEEERMNTLHLMQWILFAAEPITTSQLRYALAVSGKDPPKSLEAWAESRDYLEDGEQFEYLLVDRSKGLTEVLSSKRVQLIHASVEDFLVKGGGLQLLDMSLDHHVIGQSHAMLLYSCIAYIALREIQQHPRQDATKATDPWWITFCEEFPLLMYAVDHIITHAQAAEEDGYPQITLPRRSTTENVETLKLWCHLYPISWGDSASIRGRIFSLLQGIPPDRALLFIACQANLPDCVTALVSAGTSVDGDFGGLGSLLAAACLQNVIITASHRKENSRIARLLLETTHEPNFVDSTSMNQSTALHSTAKTGNLKLANVLLEYHAQINLANLNGKTALYLACLYGNADMCLLLLEHGASVRLETVPRSNVLTAAISSGNEVIIRSILERDPYLELEDEISAYGTPLCACCFSGDISTMKILLLKGVDLWNPSIQRSALEQAAGATDQDQGENMLQSIVFTMAENNWGLRENVNRVDSRGNTLLHYAADYELYKLALFLLEQLGADTEVKDREGETPVQIAIRRADIQMANILICNHARVDAPLKYQVARFPSDFAAKSRMMDKYLKLIKKGKTPQESFEMVNEVSEREDFTRLFG